MSSEALRTAIDVLLEDVPLSVLTAEFERMMRSYRSETPGSDTLASADAVAAYLAYRMPATHASALAALAETRLAIPDLAPRRVVDVGGGTGSVGWAATQVFPTLAALTVADRSRTALDAGRRLAAHAPHQALRSAEWVHDPGLRTRPGTEDLAVAAYVIGELPPDEREALVDRLAREAGTVVLIEPGTPAGFDRIRKARRILADGGMSIAAPCPHDRPCPVPPDDWCHFSARFDRSALLRRLKGAEQGHEDEKYSYVAGTRRAVEPATARVIRHPRYRKGLVGLDMCTVADGLVDIAVPRRDEAYREARSVRWGDRWTGTEL